MLSAPVTGNEAARLQTLKLYDVLDSQPEAPFDDLTTASARIFDTPISLITLIDEARQWFKSGHGITFAETDRDIAFCAHAILGDDTFVVEDARADRRFADNPLVTGAPCIRFYAGAPLVVADRSRLGTLCIIDTVPRSLDAEHLETLEVLRDAVVANLELRRIRADSAADLLTVCAWCNRIRYDADECWVSPQEFVFRDHRLTHSICPTCRNRVAG